MFKRWLQLSKDQNTLLTGSRRVGKTTLLKSTFPDYQYVTLDDFDYLDLALNDPKALSLLAPSMIIDEIQRVPKLTIAVKYALDEKNSRFQLSGSSKMGLLDAGVETLAGRIYTRSLPTMCFGESEGQPTHSIFDDRLSLIQLKEAHRQLSIFMKYGGFPEVVIQTDPNQKYELLRMYRNSYFTRDLAMISNIENISGLNSILNHYSLSIGSITQVSTFRNESNLAHQTAQKYLNVIYASELGFQLLGFQFGPAKRYIKAPKSYFADNGILTSLNNGYSIGQLVENFVISEIEKRRKLNFYGDVDTLYYYQSIGGGEIDLIIPMADHIKAIEIKATEHPTAKDIRNLKEFVKTKGKLPVKAYLFYMGLTYQTVDDVLFIPISAMYRGR